MRLQLSIVALLLVLLSGCAAYKELQPEPPIGPAERGYIELKDDQNDFELEQGSKYYIQFPPPMRNHYKLVLVTEAKPALQSFLTDSFDGGEGPFKPIADETASNDSIMVYAVGTRPPAYFWVIENVRHDLILSLRYRYVPEWRYTFENKHALYKRTLAENTVDRTTYESIDPDFSFEDFNFTKELGRLDDRRGKIKAMSEELDQLASIFPEDIAASRDTAYQQYKELRSRVTDEMTFQENYSTILRLFKKEKDTRGDMGKFLEAVPYFTSIVSQGDKYPEGVIEKARGVLLERLGGTASYYEAELRGKNNVEPITPNPSPEAVAALYRACGRSIPGDTEDILRFVQRFNTESRGLAAARGKFRDLTASFKKGASALTPQFFEQELAKVREIRSQIPEPLSARIEKYGSYPAAAMMTDELGKAVRHANDLELLYGSASRTATELQTQSWGAAESGLRQLADDLSFSNPAAVAEQRGLMIKRFEGEIFNGVRQASQQRVDTFAKMHETTYQNVPKLYEDSVFLPVYQLTFSSAGPNDLARKRKEIEDYLTRIKTVQFPETSIKTIYREFTRNINDHGVEKARAIADHGKFYRGPDKQVLAMIDECNVSTAKWIVKAREYRKVYALPLTTNRQGTNEYMFRIGLNIPSDAQFPVFDINIKLPQEVAQKAAASRWYDEITINKKPIKNEGRFRITTPMASNDFESLITPVQMDKQGNNVLEVKFRYPGFKVFEVSAMAQVPIIRKN